MSDEMVIINEVKRMFNNRMFDVNDRLDKIDYHYGKRISIIEEKITSIEQTLDTLGKELREQYYSLGRRMELLELHLLYKDRDKENK